MTQSLRASTVKLATATAVVLLAAGGAAASVAAAAPHSAAAHHAALHAGRANLLRLHAGTRLHDGCGAGRVSADAERGHLVLL